MDTATIQTRRRRYEIGLAAATARPSSRVRDKHGDRQHANLECVGVS